MKEPYEQAQEGMTKLKQAVYLLLKNAPDEGLKNNQIGRSLGIYMGHIEHEGHISRTVLAILEHEEVVEQNPETKAWKLRIH